MSYQNYQFVVRRGPQEGQIFPLTGDTISLGRDPMADITIADPEISRQHARLTKTAGGGYDLQDLGSTNGTFVDGNRLGGEKVLLAPGQIVVVGSNVTLVYEMLPEQTATVIASREELGFDAPVVAAMAEVDPDPAPAVDMMEVAATERLSDSEPLPNSDATIIDHSFDQPAYPVFSAAASEPEPSFVPDPLPSYDDSWSTPASDPVDKGMPMYEPASSTPPPPPPPMGDDSSDGNSNRNRILIAIVVVLLLCCCCSLLTSGWFYGDTIMSSLGL